MFAYQLSLAWQAILRYRRLSILIVLAISLGLAAALSTLTIVYRLGSDPQPSRSGSMYAILIDAWGAADSNGWGGGNNNPPDQLTYMDAMALWDQAPAEKQAPMFSTGAPVVPSNPELSPFMQGGRATSRHFFDIVGIEFTQGATWSQADDEAGAAVTVIGPELAKKLFGDANPIGQQINFNSQPLTVIGVIDPIDSPIRFYDITTGPMQDAEQLYLPLRYIINREMANWGNNNCWSESEPGYAGRLASECIWLQYWVQLNDAEEVARYQSFIDGYADAQKQLGRFARTTRNNRVVSLRDFLVMQGVVPDDAKLANVIGFAFLAVALINAIGLMLAKFLRNTRALAVHRALGASRSQLFQQHLIEAGVIGALAAGLGVVFTALTLAGLRALEPDLKNIAHLDFSMFAALALIALLGSVAAGVIPAWRISRLQPASALRSN